MRTTNSICALAVVALAAIGGSGCGRAARPQDEIAARPPPQATPRVLDFEATAYSIEGKTASGAKAKEGVVAADPDLLPIGTRIQVREAGEYSGTYVVSDTGRAVQGREVDIYVPNDAEAKRFGRRRVKVEVLGEAR
jgi:3D (Asp-Asp-Asp) domain-containing protein